MRTKVLGGGILIRVMQRSLIIVFTFLLSTQVVPFSRDRSSFAEGVKDTYVLPGQENEFDQIGGGFFTENLGQWGESLDFFAKTRFGTAALTGSGVDFKMGPDPCTTSVTFEGSTGSDPVGIGDMGFPTNFFLGNDPDRWVTGVRSYERVRYRDVWTGIDIEYYFSGSDLKYDIIVHPSGDTDDIEMSVSGHKNMVVDQQQLSVSLPDGGSLMDRDLKAMSDLRSDIPVHFIRKGVDSYGFDIEKMNDETLVIDPLIYSTLIAGGAYPADLTKDDTNCTYLLAYAYGPDLPVTPGAYNTTYWGVDYYLMKMNSSGTGIVFATVIGGYSVDVPVVVKVDDKHDIYIGGQSCSPDFPTTPGVIQTVHNSVDDYVIMKLNSTGDRLIYSTFIGGDGPDILGDIEVRDDEVYLTGYALSHDIPSMMGPIGGVHGALYFSIINHNATAFIDSHIWDGYYGEFPTCLEIDSNGEVVIGGYTGSSDFPTTPHSYQYLITGLGSRGFIIRYDPSGIGTIFSSMIGACSVYDLKLDQNSDICYVGVVRWDPYGSIPEFPLTQGTFNNDFFGYNDIFAGKLSRNGTRLLWSTVVGGSQNETGPNMALDIAGNIYVTGTTESNDLPTTRDCYDASLNDEKDVFFFKMNENGSRLLYSSYFGTNSTEESHDLLLDGMNNITLFGVSSAEDFPVTDGAFTLKNITYGGMFLSVLTISTPPGQTRELAAVEGDGNISLTWERPIDDGNGPITNYQIYRGPDPLNLTRYHKVGDEREFLDEDVDFGVEYYYGVSAVNRIGEGCLSNIEWNISSTLPDPPVHLRAEVNIGHILLKFDPPAFTGGVNITGYNIYRNEERIMFLGPGELSFTDLDIGLGIDYAYTSTSLNRKGESLKSRDVAVRSKDLPSPPTDLTVRPLHDSIVIRWQEPVDFGGLDVQRYILYKGTSEDGLNPVRSLDPEVIQYEDPYVVKGDQYFYSVSACNQLGESELAAIASAIPMSLPSKPFNLRATPGIGYINLSWSAPIDNGGDENIFYKLYHGTNGFEARLLVILNGSTTGYQHTGLEGGIKHQYYVTTCNLIGESEGTEVIYASSFSLPLPPSKIDLEPGPGNIKISWERPSTTGSEPVEEYIITRRTASTEPSVVASVESGTRSYIDELVVRKTTYFYSIQTVTDTGTSESSHEVSARSLTYSDPPVNVRVVVTGHGLSVSWNPPVYDGGLEITWYSLFRKDQTGLNVLIRNVEANNTSAPDNSVDPGIFYSYTVKAHNLAGPSEPSEPAGNVHPGSPRIPTLLLVEEVAGKIMLSWAPNATDQGDNTDSYNVYRTSPGMQVQNIARLDGYVLIYLDNEIEPGMSYEYYITAANEAGESGGSNRLGISIAPEEPKDDGAHGSHDLLTYSMAALLILIVLVIIVMATAGRRKAADDEVYNWEEE